MYATTLMAPITSGLLTTVNFDENIVVVLCIVGFLGVAVGLGNQTPMMAAQTVLPVKGVPTGIALTGFAGGLGSALFISISTTLFHSRLATKRQSMHRG